MENKKQAKQTQLDKYYKSIINQDKCAVVICNLSHIIIDMNQAAICSIFSRDCALWQSIIL